MLSRAEEKRVRGLRRRRNREAEGLFLAEGVRVVEEALDAGIVLRLAVRSSTLEDSERGRDLARRLEAAAPVRRVEPAVLDRLADTETAQGVLVVAEIPTPDLAGVEPEGPAVALLLDGVQDPGNLGTLVRTAAAFGCDVVACLPGTVDPWNPKVVRAAAGALFRVPVLTADPVEVWGWLADHAFAALAADASGRDVRGLRLPQRVALVVGNEGAGVSDAVRSRCEERIAVPMRGGMESLNVAIAAGILLYEITRGRE